MRKGYPILKKSRLVLGLLIIFMVISTNGRAQRVPESKIIPSTPQLLILKNFRRNASDSALGYGQNLIEKARLNKDSWLESEASLELARIYFAKNDQIKALELSLFAESIAKPYNESYYTSPQFSAFILNRQGKSNEALSLLFNSLKRSDSVGISSYVNTCYFAIADVYRETSNCDMALVYAFKGLYLAKSYHDTSQIITAFATLSNIYSNTGYRNDKRLDSALYYYRKIMVPPFFDRWVKPYDSARHFSNMGRLLRLHKEYDAAKTSLRLGLEVAERKNFKSLQQILLNEQMSLELDLGNDQKALILGDRSKNLMALDQLDLKKVKELTDRTTEILDKTGNFKEAYSSLMVSDRIKDSLFNLSKINATVEIEKKYQRDTKVLKAENLLQRAENRRNQILFLSIILIVILSSYFIWRTNKKNQQTKFLSTLIHEVNHRTKNNLQMLNSLISVSAQNLVDENAKSELNKLKSYIKSFGLMYDNLNMKLSFDEVNLSEYTEAIGKAVIGNQHEEKTKLLYSAEDRILVSADKAILIGLIMNELITNSLKYAYNSVSKKGIEISLTLSENHSLKISYMDSGEGYKLDALKPGSFGLKMIMQLVKQLKGSISMDEINLAKLHIMIPLI
jgi:two-component sensor histidine kinase